MRDPFRVGMRIGPVAYVAGVTGAYLAQHLYVWVATEVMGRPVALDATFWLLPFRKLAGLEGANPAWLAGGLLVSLAAAGALAVLSFGRVGARGQGAGWAALSIVPVLQLLAFVRLALVPPSEQHPGATEGMPGAGWLTATQGVLAGTGLIVFAVAASTLVFGVYGFGLFVLSPLLVGFTTGFLANRGEVLSAGLTAGWVAAAAGLGGLMLLIFGLEGGICMVMATPITALVAMVGGAIGRQFAIAGRDKTRPTVTSVAILPLVFAIETALPTSVTLDTYETIEVAAPPAAVWWALIDMGEIEPAPSLAFRLGLAFPLRARFNGEGVGVERIGVFSTGVARERVTAWVPGRRLAFKVLSNPPSMRELSPRAEVNAPHVNGYFETAWTSFDLEPLPGGHTRLVERASHSLRLDPVLYWEPLARWAIHQNNRRVMEHIKRRAEVAARV